MDWEQPEQRRSGCCVGTTLLCATATFVTARQRLAFAASLALHDGFVLAPREFTLAAVPTLAARPGADGRPCHPMHAMVLDAAPLHLAGAYMPALAVVRRARDQGWAWLDGGAPRPGARGPWVEVVDEYDSDELEWDIDDSDFDSTDDSDF